MNQNPLYPIFLKLHALPTLIVGAGNVGLEKLTFILKSSPEARITVVAREVSPEVDALLAAYPHVRLLRRAYMADDLRGKLLVIAATNDRGVNERIQRDAHQAGLLVNVADTPELCDFYLGAIVTRGNLKVAISTNGQSPTFAKRFRQTLEEILPEDTDQLLANLKGIRDQLKGGFAEKVSRLNALTADLLPTRKEVV